MKPELTLLYRGPLSSCNYGCPYCPFAKRRESDAEHAADAQALERFLLWCEGASRPLRVFFTPWGEALIRRRYQQALVRLCAMPHVRRAVIQTNLSCRLDWVEACPRDRLALWCTFHPGETTLERFLSQCRRLQIAGVRFSVGVVGLKEHLEAIEALRSALDPSVYLWVNAFKRVPDYYRPEELERLLAVDRLFPLNNTRHASLGLDCATGNTVISVNGDGVMRRCHFVREPIGSLYDECWEEALQPRPCPQEQCGCYIGYSHLQPLRLRETYGDGLLERIPSV